MLTLGSRQAARVRSPTAEASSGDKTELTLDENCVSNRKDADSFLFSKADLRCEQ